MAVQEGKPLLDAWNPMGLALPYSPEAEQSVLGAVLLDASCLDRIAEILPRPSISIR